MADAVNETLDTVKQTANAAGNAVEDEVAKLDSGPHLESLDRVCQMPVIHSAIEITGSTYAYVKESSDLLNWALNHVESGIHYASATAAPITTPIVKTLERPINAVDQTICKGFDMVGQTVATVKEQPQHISDAAKAVMSYSVTPVIEKLTAVKDSATEQATSLKDSAVAKADELLNTEFGSMAVKGVDNSSAAVNRLLDRYFPPVVGTEEVTPVPISPEENKILHTVQTVGQLSTKSAQRVYHSIAAQLKTVKKEDVTAYMNRVVSILHLTKTLGTGDKKDGDEETAISPEAEKKDDEIEIKEKM